MVWHCENCNKAVDVLAEIQGSGSFSERESKEGIWKSLVKLGFGDLLIRCYDCDSTRVVWRR